MTFPAHDDLLAAIAALEEKIKSYEEATMDMPMMVQWYLSGLRFAARTCDKHLRADQVRRIIARHS